MACDIGLLSLPTHKPPCQRYSEGSQPSETMDPPKKYKYLLLLCCLLGVVSADINQLYNGYAYDGQPLHFESFQDSILKGIPKEWDINAMKANASLYKVNDKCKRDMMIIEKAGERVDNHTWILQREF